MTQKKEFPKMFKILLIAGILMASVGIALIIIGASKQVPNMSEAGWFEAESAKNGLMFGGSACLMFGVFMAIAGLSPKISKAMSQAQIQTTSQIVQENKEDLKTISDTTADISSGAITKGIRAIKRGLKDTMYCKHCGKEIEVDSTFCKYCGKHQ